MAPADHSSFRSINNKNSGRLGLGRKERFGRENFNLTKAVNGSYFRLLLSTLSSSGR